VATEWRLARPSGRPGPQDALESVMGLGIASALRRIADLNGD
jgi:hypothetical protein